MVIPPSPIHCSGYNQVDKKEEKNISNIYEVNEDLKSNLHRDNEVLHKLRATVEG